MASPATIPTSIDVPLSDAESDYGSDFTPEEELIVTQLLSQTAKEDNPIVNEFEHHEERKLRLPRVGRGGRSPLSEAIRHAEKIVEQINETVGQTSGDSGHPDLSNPASESLVLPSPTVDGEAASEVLDTRSPLERFRTPPRKGLSVTDIISPAWCELQYWYSLTKHGRVKPTLAMKRGTKVHQKLEDQVHTTVKVEVITKEDGWALRLWNVIQGLRTLRETGLTRELEIWGIIDGQVITGVIDELSYICPDTDLEESLNKLPAAIERPLNQATIADFFKAQGSGTFKEAVSGAKRRMETDRVYLCDVKTRGAKSLPSGAAFRPTKMQLMLYHRLLSALATNTVDFSIFTQRYKLDPDRVFSDSFLAQVGNLNYEILYSAPPPQEFEERSEVSSSAQDSMLIFLTHNTLSKLWSLMIQEFQYTLPNGERSLGGILKAEYRNRVSGEVMGSKTLAMNDAELTSYVDDEMKWWKGERAAKGVNVEEAYKCRSCEFAESCEWRLAKVEEATEKSRLRRSAT